MRTHISPLLAFFLGISMFPIRAQAQTNPNSSAAHNPSASESDDPSWLFPVAKLDEVLPRWFHIGGEYRDRLEGPLGTGFANTSDFYVLDRLRMKIRIEPKDWLTFFGEVQDARIFFNHHIPNANPFEAVGLFGKAMLRSAVPPQVGSMRLQVAKSSSLVTSE